MEIIGTYRKGLAIGRIDICNSQSYLITHKSFSYHLVNEKGEIVYTPRGLYAVCIHRLLDGYYCVTAMEPFGYRTFPGKDRDTEFCLKPSILFLLDEYGNLLHKEEQEDYYNSKKAQYAIELGENFTLHTDSLYHLDENKIREFNPIKYIEEIWDRGFSCKEEDSHYFSDYNYLKYRDYIYHGKSVKSRTTENGEILCGNSFYYSDNRTFAFKINKKIEPLDFFRNGRCKVGIVSDYRDFIVLVHNSEIVSTYNDVNDFRLISSIIENYKNESPKNNNGYQGQINLPEVEEITEIHLDAEVEIEKYSINFPHLYLMDNQDNPRICTDNNYGIKRYVSHCRKNNYFNIDGEWYYVKDCEANRIYEQIFEQECNRPNFIRDIKLLCRNVLVGSDSYSIYRFECRPYGYITKEGKLEYNFDVNNIKW
ncbi:MAG: hypothetical protein J6X88_03095 [Bacteroidales bacterium]|nr:hypothetical protein [Bacteroidales bacterium]